jgi:hypothetical protein
MVGGAVDKTRLYGRLDRSLVALAAGQHGVFAIWQARGLGLTENVVQKRCRAGRLYRLYRGVYALMPAGLLSREGRWLAAVLACGPEAALSHRSAAHLHELRATSRQGVDVIVARGRDRRHAGIDAHQSMHLIADDLTVVNSIPVTTFPRTALDLAAVVDQRAVERVIEEAVIRGMFDLSAITDQLARNPKHPGAPKLRAALGPERAGLTDSDLEELFVAIWWPTGLPCPKTQFHIDPGDGGPLIRADFAWPDAKFDLETDGGRYHASDRRRRRDYRRDQRLKRANWEVLRVGDDQLNDEPDGVVTIVWKLLAPRLPWDIRRQWP